MKQILILRKPLLIGILIFAALIFVQCGKTEAKSESEISRLIAEGALVVDVRTPEEFASGAYPGAVNIPLSQVPDRLSEFGAQDRPIVVYCHSGNRSSQARAILRQAGYSQIYNGGGLRDMPRKP